MSCRFVFVFLAFVLGSSCHAQVIGPGPESLWPGAVVPYTIDANFRPEDRANLDRAIADYHSKTCIRWVPRTTESAYAHFQNVDDGCAYSDNCYSPGSVKRCSFGGCKNWDTMVHEMGHLLCFGHEQDRLDRDNYLDSPRCTGTGRYDHLNFGHLYDYKSIMHYGMDRSCFKMPGVTNSGSSKGLNVLDAEKLNDAYNCPGCQSYRFRFPNMIDASSNPVIAGQDGTETLYPCRAYVNGDIVPGKARLGSSPACWVPYNGGEHGFVDGFEILTNPARANLAWTRGNGGSIPSNAIAGGRTDTDEVYYIVRCLKINGQDLVTPGKFHVNRAYASYGGREWDCSTDFEFLVC